MTSDAGGLLLGAADRHLDLVRRLAGCFRDARDPRLVEALGRHAHRAARVRHRARLRDLNDHDGLRHDPLMGVLAGKLKAWRSDCAPAAGKSTLNRLELSRDVATRYHEISHHPAAIEALFVDLFLETHGAPPRQMVLDLNATDDRCMAVRKAGSSTAIPIAIASVGPSPSRLAPTTWRGCPNCRRRRHERAGEL